MKNNAILASKKQCSWGEHCLSSVFPVRLKGSFHGLFAFNCNLASILKQCSRCVQGMSSVFEAKIANSVQGVFKVWTDLTNNVQKYYTRVSECYLNSVFKVGKFFNSFHENIISSSLIRKI